MQNEKMNDTTNVDSTNLSTTPTPLADEVVDMLGTKKAAIFLLTLGDEISGEIFKSLSTLEQEKILVEIASPGQIPPEVRAGVMDEFFSLLQAQGVYMSGGWGKVESILNAAYGGKGRAKDMTDRLQSVISNQPFSDFRDTDPSQLYGFLRNESEQTIALVLSYIPSDQAAEVLRMFRSLARNEITKRIAMMSAIDRDAVKQVESVLKEKIKPGPADQWTREGPETLAQILNKSSRDIVDPAMDYIINRGGPEGPEVAQRVKDRMFTFEDITLLSDFDISTPVMRAVEDRQLATALRGESEEVIDKFRRNTPERRWKRIDTLMKGPRLSRREISEAQRNIIDKIRALDDAGEVRIVRSSEEMVE